MFHKTISIILSQKAMGLLVGLSCVLACLGALLAWWAALGFERAFRAELLRDTHLLQQAVEPQRVLALSGTESDLDTPDYLRLKEQLAAVCSINPHYRFVYLSGRRADGVVFMFVDNESVGSSGYSPPGQVYEEATDAFRSVFDSGLAFVEGPVRDRWGKWISALAPLKHPSGEGVIAVLGVDIDARDWNRMLARAILPSLLLTVSLIVIVLVGGVLLIRRSRVQGLSSGWMGHIEAALTVAIGLAISLFIAWTAGQQEALTHRAAFRQLAESRTDAIAETLRDMHNTELESLARFYEGSEEVTAEEFRHFTGYLTQNPAIHLWAWVEVVSGALKSQFEAEARSLGRADYEIWQRDDQGKRVPATDREIHYPVLHLTQRAGIEYPPGYDLASVPVVRAFLDEAAQSGMPGACESIAWMGGGDGEQMVLFCRPVFDRERPEKPAGFALAGVRTSDLLIKAVADRAVVLEMAFLRRDADPDLLAYSWASDREAPGKLKVVRPVFLFGKTFTVTAHAGSAFLRLNPTRMFGRVAFLGLFLSVMLGGLVGMVFRRRLHLERLVAERTATLRTSEMKYRMITDNSLDRIWQTDMNLVFTYINPNLDDLAFAPEQVIGQHLSVFVAPEEWPRIQAMFEQQVARGPNHRGVILETVGVTKQGGSEALEVRALILFDDAGKPYGIQGITRDITERKKAEIILQKRLAYEGLLSRISTRAVRADDMARFQNDCLAMIGETLHISRVYIVEYDEDGDSFNNTFEWCAEGVDSQIADLQAVPCDSVPWWSGILKAGETICYSDIEDMPDERAKEILRFWGIRSVLVAPLFQNNRYFGFMGFDDCQEHRQWPEEDVEFLVAISRVIMSALERQWAEQVLVEKNDQYRSLFENNYAIMLLSDPESGAIVDANPAASAYYGWSCEQLARMNVSDINSLSPNEINEGAQNGKDARQEQFFLRHRHADGSVSDVEVYSGPIQVSGRQLLYSIVHDVTERKLLEEQLLQSQKMESVGRLAGGVAHDFNNMLGAILGYTELALEQVEPGQALHGNLLEIMKAADRSAKLTQQLLGFARKQTIEPRALDMNESIEQMLKMLRRLIGENIELVWRPAAELPPVYMDPVQVDQLLANLCVNAGDAISDIGKISIETRSVAFDEAYCAAHPGAVPGAYVVLVVSDTGCGMDREVLDHVFEPFYTTKVTGKGTGLGLATVYGIVKQNNGFINIYSEPDRGTTFSIYLPQHRCQPSVVAAPITANIPQGAGERLLLVEDDVALLNMGRMILERQGYIVLQANGPHEAMQYARDQGETIDLLITDVIMPDMNGRELAETLSSHFPKLKCLFMSGYTADIIAHHGVLGEETHFIQKPFSIRDLAVKVRQILDE